MLDTKYKLLEAAKAIITTKIETAQSALYSAKESKLNETKSSAGDKFETGRAMMQVEQEKAEMRLSLANQLMVILDNLDFDKKYNQAQIGSLVITNQLNYFLSVGIGKLVIDNNTYYAVSELSPIGKLIIGKKQNETFKFRDQVITIKSIS